MNARGERTLRHQHPPYPPRHPHQGTEILSTGHSRVGRKTLSMCYHNHPVVRCYTGGILSRLIFTTVHFIWKGYMRVWTNNCRVEMRKTANRHSYQANTKPKNMRWGKKEVCPSLHPPTHRQLVDATVSTSHSFSFPPYTPSPSPPTVGTFKG